MDGLRKLLRGRYGRLILALAALLLLIPLAMQLLSPEPDYSTGDPLYDRLQAEVQLKLNGKGEHGTLTSQWVWPAAPSVKTVESWESEFGGRSDYWCLLALCHSVQQGGVSLDRGLLERAARCSESDSGVHGRLMEMRLLQIRMSSSLDAWQEDEQTAEVIDEYRRKFPESAWVCYLAADHLSYYGMSEQYVEMLELGNRLPDPRVNDPFPLSMVLEEMKKSSFKGNPLVAGSVLRIGESLTINRFGGTIRTKDQYKEMMAVGTELGLARGINALYQREIRCWNDDPLPTVLSPTLIYLTEEIFSAAELGCPRSDVRKGISQWQADCQAFIAWNSGMTERLRRADPDLAAQVLPGDPEHGLPGQRTIGSDFGILDSILQRTVDKGRLSRHLASTEYEYFSYMLENEAPKRKKMLDHLATFDFEHPEQYVPMGGLQ